MAHTVTPPTPPQPCRADTCTGTGRVIAHGIPAPTECPCPRHPGYGCICAGDYDIYRCDKCGESWERD